MTEHLHFSEPRQSFHLEPSFTGFNDSLYPTSAVLRRTSRVSHASNPSWISGSIQPAYSYNRPPSTMSRPLPTPVPSTSARGMYEPQHPPLRLVTPLDQEQDPEPVPERTTTGPTTTDQDYDVSEPTEFMTVMPSSEPDQGDMYGQSAWSTEPDIEPEPVKQKGKAKAFVGGFVSGLRRLPKAISRPRLRENKLTRRNPADFMDTAESSTPLPRYDDPGRPIPSSSNVQYVQGMEMPVEQPASTQLSYVDESHYMDAIPDMSLPQSRERQSGDTSSVQHDHHPRPIVTRLSSPVQVDPELTSDYAKMESPIHTPKPDDSFRAYYKRIRDFIKAVNDLPWISSPLTVEYIPQDSSRARPENAKPTPWYTARQHQKVDLLAAASSRSQVRLRREETAPHHNRLHGHSTTTFSQTSPASRRGPSHARETMSTAASPRSPHTSSQSHGHGRRQGSAHGHGHRQSPAHNSYVHNYYYPTQPMLVYPSPGASPASHHTPQGQPSPGGFPGQPGQPLPVYMVASPSPMMMPMAPPPAHAPTHIQFSTTSSMPPPGMGDTSAHR